MERLDFVADSYNPVEATIHMARYLNAKPYVEGKRVLDVACGEGYGSCLMKQWGAKEVVGVDISEEAVQNAQQLFGQEGVTYIQHIAESLPFEDDSFDVGVSLETIEHLDDPVAFLKELRRVVKPDGILVVSCPNDQYYADNVKDFENPYHQRRYTYFEFKELAEKILGGTELWYIGGALSGFVNYALSECTFPEKGPESPEDMRGMFHYNHISETYRVPASKYLNYWNGVYYVGIWGEAKKNASMTASVFPLPHFFLYPETKRPEQCSKQLFTHNDNIIADKREGEKRNRELEKQLADSTAEKAELVAENERLHRCIERFDKEKQDMAERYRVLNMERDRLKMMNDMQHKEAALHWESNLRLTEQLNQANAQLQDARALIEAMQNSKGWRMLEKLRRLIRRR